MTREELLERLSVISYDDERIVLIAFSGEPSQLAFAEEPGVMLVDFSDENLIENCEFPEKFARDIQQHKAAVIDWIKAQGYQVNETK
jgi:sugar diacid utilization regulator